MSVAPSTRVALHYTRLARTCKTKAAPMEPVPWTDTSTS